MSDRTLIHQLSELRRIKQAPAVWRIQTRQRLMSTAENSTPIPFRFTDRLYLAVQRTQFAVAPLKLIPVTIVIAGLLLGYAPLASATLASLPGDTLYGVKRAVESVELSFKPTPAAQGKFRLELASRRLEEAVKLPVEQVGNKAELLRDYNINLAFAQANLQAAPVSSELAQEYDRTADFLAQKLNLVTVTPQTKPIRDVAVQITSQLGDEALALLVGAHVSGHNGVASTAVAARLTEEISKVEARLDGVEVRINEFPTTKPAPKVVLEKRVAIVPVQEASRQAKESLSQARTLLEKNEFGLALEKVQESEEITKKTEDAVTVEEETVKDAKQNTEPADSTEQSADDKGEVKGEATEKPVTEEPIQGDNSIEQPVVVPETPSVQP